MLKFSFSKFKTKILSKYIISYAGFDEKAKFKACCGYGGDPYNYTPLVACGKNPAAKVCTNRGEYISWDGVHFTEAFNQRFVDQLAKGLPILRPPSRGHSN